MAAIIIISFLKLPLISEGSTTREIVGRVSSERGYSPLICPLMARPSIKASRLDSIYSFTKIDEAPIICEATEDCLRNNGETTGLEGYVGFHPGRGNNMGKDKCMGNGKEICITRISRGSRNR